MKTLTIFEAADGARFDSAEKATAHERLCEQCKGIEAMLGSHPDDSGARVKHPRLREFRLAVVDLCRELYPREPIFQNPADEIHPFSWAGRFLSDSAPRPVNQLWYRLMCVGNDGYEYEQPYFARNPDKFTARVTAQAGKR